MIDEKKIEEAAIKHISSNEYSSYNSGEIEDEMILCKAKNSFKAGINWFLNNLWHDASEEPKENKDILTEYFFDAKQGKKYCKLDLHKPSYYPWQQKIINEQITRWLYIEDLMKGGK